MTLTEYFYNLQPVDKAYNKYATYSLTFNNPYRICTSYDAFKYDKFDLPLKSFLAAQGKSIALPNILNGEIIGILFRSLASKQFRYYTEAPNIPYGAGINNKPYYKPWLIVESALDSDFLRNFYPFVISTNGVNAGKSTIDFLKGTCSTLYCGYDTDIAGENAFHNLCKKYSGKDDCFHIKRFKTPVDFNGKQLKDFGEVLDLLHEKNISDYDYYCSSIKSMLFYI